MSKKHKLIQETMPGFEDFLQDKKIKTRTRPVVDRSDEGKISSFLENNYTRLEKTSKFIQSKLPNYIDYNQSESVTDAIQKAINKKRQLLIDQLIDIDSDLHLEQAEIFSDHFRKKISSS
jgi:tRNA U34 5-carboxymethylaminomethyl modifying enzyme MnmG/GidA